jgi:hypothetical protein
MRLLILAFLLSAPSCNAIRDYRQAKAINDNLSGTDEMLYRYAHQSK